jgi:alpha-galactosidase
MDNGLALTPPMGWNSWNKFGCNINEELIKSTADALVSSGMKDAGYVYLIIDDAWQNMARDSEGNISPDQKRFPSGIKALAGYVHSKGLKFGIYSDAGKKTCGGRPGSRGYEFQDARQYAAWGVDYLKYDWCYTGSQNAKAAYLTMRDALKLAGRPVVFSICEWGNSKPWLWGKNAGNLWRTTGDICDSWISAPNFSSFTKILDVEAPLYPYAGPGHWNDPDMLEVGNGGMTVTEYRAHFSLWCILAAPLIAGNDLRAMTPEIRDILMNKEAIAVDQDALGKQGQRVRKNGNSEVWVKEMKDNSRAVVLFNRGQKEARIIFGWKELGFPSGLEADVRDLWQKKDLGKSKAQFGAKVESHGAVMLRVFPPQSWLPPVKAEAAPPIVYDACDANLSGGLAVSTDNEGYTGKGFVQGYFMGTGQRAAFKIEAEKDRHYKPVIRYNNSFGNIQQLSLYVNDKFVKKIKFKATGDSDSWGEHVVDVALKNGKNTVAFRKDEGDGCVILDCLSVKPAG